MSTFFVYAFDCWTDFGFGIHLKSVRCRVAVDRETERASRSCANTRSLSTKVYFWPNHAVLRWFFRKSRKVCQNSPSGREARRENMKFHFLRSMIFCVALNKINKSSWMIEIIGKHKVWARKKPKKPPDRHRTPETIVEPLPRIILCV